MTNNIYSSKITNIFITKWPTINFIWSWSHTIRFKYLDFGMTVSIGKCSDELHSVVPSSQTGCVFWSRTTPSPVLQLHNGSSLKTAFSSKYHCFVEQIPVCIIRIKIGDICPIVNNKISFYLLQIASFCRQSIFSKVHWIISPYYTRRIIFP